MGAHSHGKLCSVYVGSERAGTEAELQPGLRGTPWGGWHFTNKLLTLQEAWEPFITHVVQPNKAG